MAYRDLSRVEQQNVTKWTKVQLFCYHRRMLQFPRWRVDVTVEGVPEETFHKTFYETATTSKAAVAKAKHKMRGAVSSAGAFKFKASKVDEPSGHATKKKQKEKRLHFAGYDFTSGPEGTVVHRPTSTRSEFQPGDRVEYRDVNLWQQGTVTGSDGKWIMVRWDGNSFESREWAPNLRHVSTGVTSRSARAHATKKSPAQLQREIDEVLGRWEEDPFGGYRFITTRDDVRFDTAGVDPTYYRDPKWRQRWEFDLKREIEKFKAGKPTKLYKMSATHYRLPGTV